jgi:hypothetical protein
MAAHARIAIGAKFVPSVVPRYIQSLYVEIIVDKAQSSHYESMSGRMFGENCIRNGPSNYLRIREM